MNEFFKTRSECFLYLKRLYDFYEEYQESGKSEWGGLDEDDISIGNSELVRTWFHFLDQPDIKKQHDDDWQYFFFSWNLLRLNLDDLNNLTCYENNFDIPERNSFEMEFSFTLYLRRRGRYEYEFETFTTESQIFNNEEEIMGDYRDYWDFSPDFETVRHDIENLELDRIRKSGTRTVTPYPW